MRAFVLAALLRNVAGSMVKETYDSFFVASGRKFSFVVEQNQVKATGSNKYGQLGQGSILDQETLVDINFPEGRGVRAIVAGAFHGLFIADERLYATGSNRYGQFGGQVDGDAKTPQWITTATGVVSAAAGYGHSLIVRWEGDGENRTTFAEASGRNLEGQLGVGSTASASVFQKVTLGEDEPNVVKVAAGYDFSYFLTDGGDLWATGQNLGGQLGDGTCLTSLVPVKVLSDVQDMAAGESHGLFLMNDGRVLGTGANHDGQLGDGSTQHKCRPVSIGTTKHQKVAAGGDSSCFTMGNEYKLFCSGSNRDGQLGFGGEPTKTTPTLVPGVVSHVESISVSDSHSLFLAHPGEVFVSGTNDYGELGLNKSAATNTVEVLTSFDMSDTTPTTTATTTEVTRPVTTSTTTGATVTRDQSGADDSNPIVWVAVGIGGLVLLVACGVFLSSGSGSSEASGGGGAGGEDRDLELIRAEMSS